MKSKVNRSGFKTFFKLTVVAAVVTAVVTALWQPFAKSEAAAGDPAAQMYRRSAPNYDMNLARNLQAVRNASGGRRSSGCGMEVFQQKSA